ncbi:MAG: signal peptidase I [Ignavibacteriales bacterium]|nr:signal peptidase I [Ignavibacteriales bacterium]
MNASPDAKPPGTPHESTVIPSTPEPPLGRRAMSFARAILFTIFIAFLLKTFVVEAFRIPSGSMENTLLVGDFLLVNKLAYGLKTPRYVPLTNLAIPSLTFPAFGSVGRGDVVVFEYPGRHSETEGNEPVYYIKRCIGIPGDTVAIQSGDVLVDRRMVLPPSHGKSSFPGRSLWPEPARGEGREPIDGNNYGPIIVPKKGDVVALTPASVSRWRDFIEREHHRLDMDSSGTVLVDGITSSTYTVQQNYYFMLGDNRGNSLDSRFWGFVPERNIVGAALVVYWSWDPEDPGSGLKERVSKIRWSRVGMLIR